VRIADEPKRGVHRKVVVICLTDECLGVSRDQSRGHPAKKLRGIAPPAVTMRNSDERSNSDIWRSAKSADDESDDLVARVDCEKERVDWIAFEEFLCEFFRHSCEVRVGTACHRVPRSLERSNIVGIEAADKDLCDDRRQPRIILAREWFEPQPSIRDRDGG
jgi:hypothetical protein